MEQNQQAEKETLEQLDIKDYLFEDEEEEEVSKDNQKVSKSQLKKQKKIERKKQQKLKKLETNPNFKTPIDKLKKLCPYKLNIVLYLYGTFYPVHKNHIRTLEIAKQYIEENFANKYNIIGGYLAPTNLRSLRKKMKSFMIQEQYPNKSRLKMCELAVEKSD